MQPLAELVKGKSVSLVGNAKSILSAKQHNAIDSHDIVIRMNRGLPKLVKGEIGHRTDVLATAKYWDDICDCKVPLLVFMKLTPLGDKHFGELVSKLNPASRLIRWDRHLEDECRKFVGADPGTGVRLLWWLKNYSEATMVYLYGFDCWKTVSHWSNRKNTPNHRPDLERIAIDKLLLA